LRSSVSDYIPVWAEFYTGGRDELHFKTMSKIYQIIFIFLILFISYGYAQHEVEQKGITTENQEEEREGSKNEFDDLENEFEEKPEVFDPLRGYNKFMTNVNDKIYFCVFNPVGKGYRRVIPKGGRRGINRFFTNLLYPIRLVNNVLQLKFKNAGEETLRFVTNTTIGIAGFWDPAKEKFGLEAHEEDFGQTLGRYGIGSGPHIVLPVLGPSNLRDTLSLYPDYLLNPISQAKIKEKERIGIRIFDTINETSLHIGEYESLKKDAIELYPFLRDIYEQNRNKKIKE
jgi:phospholipid-binding lipoprotein MlaA